MNTQFKESADFILSQINYKPTIGVILGSGLGKLAESIENAVCISYSIIPNFPISTVDGHKGQLVIGDLGGKKVLAMQGRFHYYEGYGMDKVTFPVRVMRLLGIQTLIVSNAAGGLNPNFQQGDLMLITDHINFFPLNPLIGPNLDEFGTRFPDMGKVYDKNLRDKAKLIAASLSVKLQEGVYIGSSGPTLETPAEYRMFHLLGADATGMSTVPEVIVARHSGMKVFGMSVITNVSKPVNPDQETTHEEVQDVAGQKEPIMTAIVTKLIAQID